MSVLLHVQHVVMFTGHCRCWLCMEIRMKTGQSWIRKQWDILTSDCVRLDLTCRMEHTTR